jgi:hypothetical protein
LVFPIDSSSLVAAVEPGTALEPVVPVVVLLRVKVQVTLVRVASLETARVLAQLRRTEMLSALVELELERMLVVAAPAISVATVRVKIHSSGVQVTVAIQAAAVVQVGPNRQLALLHIHKVLNLAMGLSLSMRHRLGRLMRPEILRFTVIRPTTF